MGNRSSSSKCAWPECKNHRTYGEQMFCILHLCSSTGCNNVRREGGTKYCDHHTCCYDNCNQRSTNQNGPCLKHEDEQKRCKNDTVSSIVSTETIESKKENEGSSHTADCDTT